MLRICERPLRLDKLPILTMAELGYLERHHLQQLIKNSSDEFFGEMGEQLLLIGEEIQPSDFVQNRIDLLAIDPQGNLVIIELKRSNDKLHLLQALAYAAMISSWSDDDVRGALKTFSPNGSDEGDELAEFLDKDLTIINERQRIILISEEFDFEVLVTSEWLTERYGLSIQCYRLRISKDGDATYLSCTGIYPPPEIREHAVRRGTRAVASQPKWTDWDQVLSTVGNKALVSFFKDQLARGVSSNLSDRSYLRYSVNGAGRFFVSVRTNYAYVWQEPRFSNDNEFWRGRLSAPEQVVDVKKGQALRFWLTTADDFSRFAEPPAGVRRHPAMSSNRTSARCFLPPFPSGRVRR